MKKVNIMNFLEVFILLENKIDKLSFFEKIKLFSIPILLSITILILINDNNSFNFTIQKENRIFNKNQTKIIKDFTNYFNDNNINLQEIKQTNTEVQLSFFASFMQFVKIIYYLETYNNFSYIKHMEVLKNENSFLVSLKVGFEKFYLNNKGFKLKDFKQENKKFAFKIEAVVMNYVFIENRWYTVGDYINSYKIISISDDFIQFKKDNKVQKVFYE